MAGSRVSLTLALIALAACSRRAAPNRSSPASVAARPDTAALLQDLPRIMTIGDIPGLSMAVVQNGRITWARAFGTVNDSARAPVDTATIFEAASLSKPVFAYVVLRLVDRGEFDLDRPLYQILEYPRLAHDERYKHITGRMILSHASGLPNWGGERLDLLFEPGTAYGYSGEGFLFLQQAVERVTGRSLEQLAQREVFDPLDMRRSSFVWQERFAGDAAYATDWLRRVAPVHHYVEPNAAYTLLTTAPDYARFVAAVLTERGLSPGAWKAFLSPVRESSPGISIGLGIRIEEATAGRGRMFYHSGNNGRRFTSYMTGDLGAGTGFVYFTSAPNGTSLVSALATRVFGAEHQARHWADFDRYDDARLIALRSVERAAVGFGADSARVRLREISKSPDTRPSFDQVLELGAFMAGRKLDSLSIEILEKAVAGAPDSAGAHLALGKAREADGDLAGAVASYRRALALGDDTTDAGQQLRWANARIAERDRPAEVPAHRLKDYAGRYGERTIALRHGRLYYTRGVEAESALVPMAADLFEVEADPTLRVRFVGTKGAATKLVELSSDGSMEEALRSGD